MTFLQFVLSLIVGAFALFVMMVAVGIITSVLVRIVENRVVVSEKVKRVAMLIGDGLLWIIMLAAVTMVCLGLGAGILGYGG